VSAVIPIKRIAMRCHSNQAHREVLHLTPHNAVGRRLPELQITFLTTTTASPAVTD
jgi:hypothetical protein